MQTIKFILMLLGLIFVENIYSQTQPVIFEDWNSQEGTQNFFVRSVTKTDVSNNIYVAGATINAQGNYDILLAKYKPDGTFEWAAQYAGQGNKDDAATAIAIRGSIIYVTGHVFNTPTDSTSLVLLKYDSDGNLIWDEIYNTNNALADAGTSIFLESVGLNTEIYIGGVSVDILGNVDFLALKYNESGTLLWSKLYDHAGYIDLCHSIRVRTTLGNTTVTLAGATQIAANDWRYLTVSLNGSNGNYNSNTTSTGGSAIFSKVTGIERDAIGDIYITGSVYNAMSGYDFYTVKINASNTNVVWDATYNSSGILNDEAMALAVDSVGNVYVTGYSETSTQGTNYTTIKYDNNGNQLWVKNYNGISNGADTAKAIVLHPNGNIIVSGASYNGSNTDVVTLKYDTAGTQKWEIAYNAIFNKNDTPFDMAVDSVGDIIIAGQSQNDTGYTYTTIKYKELLVTLPIDSVSLASHYGFTPNKGQLLSTDTTLIPHIRYYTHKDQYSIYFSDTACSFVLAAIDTTMAMDTLHRVDMKYKNYMAPKVRAMDMSDYYSNFYYAHTAQGREKVHDYKQLYNANIWDKVDVLINSNAGGIKYNIIAHPGFKESNIEFEFNGHDSIYINNNEVIIETSIGNIILPEPKAYEIDANDNLTLLGWTPQYVLNGNSLSFSYGSYNTGEKLTIVIERALPVDGGNEPGVCWSTYFGGTLDERVNGITVDVNGNQYITGYTTSDDQSFPLQNNLVFLPHSQMPFASKFDASHRLEWSTYYGGTGNQAAYDIKYTSGYVYFAGYTTASNFPYKTKTGSYNDSLVNGLLGDAFVVKLDTIGLRHWATYFGGNQGERINAVAIDNNNNVYIVGYTASQIDFPVVSATGHYNQAYGGGSADAFIAKFNSADSLVWCTYYGGDASDQINSVAVDGNNAVVVQGHTYSSNFPTYFQTGNEFYDNTLGGDTDDWIAKFSSSGQRVWASLIGGSADELLSYAHGNRIAFDSQNNIYMVGSTSSNNFPVSNMGGFYQGPQSHPAGYIIKFSNSSLQRLWGTYFGGYQGRVITNAVACTQDNKVFVAGATNDTLFPKYQQSSIYYQDSLSGSTAGFNMTDGFIISFDSNRELIYGSYYGGYQQTYNEIIMDLAVFNDYLYMGGETSAQGNIPAEKLFPLSNPGNGAYFDFTFNGNIMDAFISKLCISNVTGNKEIDNTLRKQALEIYPNPAAVGEVTLVYHSLNEEQIKINIYDYQGKEILTKRDKCILGDNFFRIDVASLNRGIYFFQVINSTGVNALKFIKQ